MLNVSTLWDDKNFREKKALKKSKILYLKYPFLGIFYTAFGPGDLWDIYVLAFTGSLSFRLLTGKRKAFQPYPCLSTADVLNE